MDNVLEKWLDDNASNVHQEICENTVSGEIGLDEFANYTGHKSGKDMLRFLFKRVAEHTLHTGRANA